MGIQLRTNGKIKFFFHQSLHGQSTSSCHQKSSNISQVSDMKDKVLGAQAGSQDIQYLKANLLS